MYWKRYFHHTSASWGFSLSFLPCGPLLLFESMRRHCELRSLYETFRLFDGNKATEREMKTRRNSRILIMLMASMHCVFRCIVRALMHAVGCSFRHNSLTFHFEQWTDDLSGKPCCMRVTLTFWLLFQMERFHYSPSIPLPVQAANGSHDSIILLFYIFTDFILFFLTGPLRGFGCHHSSFGNMQSFFANSYYISLDGE